MIVDVDPQVSTKVKTWSVAIETTLAAELLRKLAEGETCSYEQLKNVIGIDPQQTKGYGYVKSARRIVERELDIVLQAVPNEGIRRASPREVVNRGTSDLRHTKKHLGDSVRRAKTLVPIEKQEKLSNEERQRFLINMSHLGLLGMLMKPKAVNTLTAAVSSQQAVLPPSNALDMFLKKSTNGNKD